MRTFPIETNLSHMQIYTSDVVHAFNGFHACSQSCVSHALNRLLLINELSAREFPDNMSYYSACIIALTPTPMHLLPSVGTHAMTLTLTRWHWLSRPSTDSHTRVNAFTCACAFTCVCAFTCACALTCVSACTCVMWIYACNLNSKYSSNRMPILSCVTVTGYH